MLFRLAITLLPSHPDQLSPINSSATDGRLEPRQLRQITGQAQGLPWDAAFLAGQAFKVYRGAQGAKTSPMPDFYIGAHALVNGLQLLTRDAARYRSYFPRLQIVAPEA